jgi:cytoskeletal protein CcmA (bactofilin family)
MAWKWPGTSKNGSNEEWTGFIDQGVSLEGTLTLTGTFRIDGHIKGNIISEQTVILGENSPCMVIDPGGIFDGRCHMLAASDTAATGVTIPIRAVSQA